MFAYDYPILGLFWSFLMVFLWIAWLMLLFRVIVDLFRNREMGGLAKAFWALFVIVLPLLGVLIYLIAHGQDMSERDLADVQASDAAFRSYVRDAAGTTSTADELLKLSDLRSRGVITEPEFEQQKSKLLAST